MASERFLEPMPNGSIAVALSVADGRPRSSSYRSDADIGEEDGQQYLAMEYVAGLDLKRYIKEHYHSIKRGSCSYHGSNSLGYAFGACKAP